MASGITLKTPYVYFKLGFGVNEENVKAFRSCYRKWAKIDQFNDHEIDETSLLEAAQELEIQADLHDYRAFLQECVKYDDMENTLLCVSILIQGSVEPTSINILPTTTSSTEHSRSKTKEEKQSEDQPPTPVSEINCVITLKCREKEVDDFLHKYLLQVIKRSTTTTESTGCRNSSLDKPFLLHPGTRLALFIREQMRSLGTIRTRQSARLRLVEPLSSTDEFSTWSYDHFRGLFNMELRPHVGNNFPASWLLVNDAHIYCQFVSNGARQADGSTTSFVSDRPRTGTLEQFVHDVFAKEDMQTKKWLDALREGDILTFAHLSNLKQTDWDNIKTLPINPKKILKAAVDRERENVADDRRRLFEESTPGEDLPQSTENFSPASRSELLANLHLIKLFIHHTLRFESTVQNSGVPSKLEGECIKASFSEMQEEGYADDGLFSTMADFFLPLTISEEELRKTRTSATRQVRRKQLDDLAERVEHFEKLLAQAIQHRWEVDDKINDLNRTKVEVFTAHINERSQIDTTLSALRRAENLQELDRQWQEDRKQLDQQLLVEKQAEEKWLGEIADYEKQIDELKRQIQNIQTELSQPPRPVDKGLVKPARGFIMFGPPGTGKSEIMSKLSMKLGICMVGPPLAAGELNRPLVGESERVIIALASRCHRVPYAMCCLSIDEIDSLAPKRDEDSSEGKVDKISVLLSLIDGIKDVPNLMIFCATNRLHMMDEAFLRRMSGKFFVGRPSSKARTRILAQIPEWALEPDLIDQLVIASTNFSGAACKAFTRAITVHCMATQRTKPDFHVNYREALKIADRTAQQYQIFLGSETLPRLLLRKLDSGLRMPMNHLSRHIYAGRIIVDLHSGIARIETIQNDDQITVILHKLHPNEKNLQSLLERLTVYGKDRNVQLLQLVDLNLLASQGAYDEKKVFETLKERYDECTAYQRSMIVYDLDALVGVNKSESDSSMGRSFSSSIVNQSVYTYVRARFREAVVERTQQDDQQQTVEKWAVAVIREPFLLRQFSTDVQFARTRKEEEEMESERRKAEDLLKCVKCKDLYIENENKMGNCVHHDGFIYDITAPHLQTYLPSEVAFELHKIECNMIKKPEEREKCERDKSKFKWICCDATYTTGSGANGCKKGKHSSIEQIGAEQRQDRQYLDQNMIKIWEEECRRNREYNEKWLALLQKHS